MIRKKQMMSKAFVKTQEKGGRNTMKKLIQNKDKNIYKASRVYCKFYWYKKVKMKKTEQNSGSCDEARAKF
jgi:hypothetical protein